MQIDDGILVVPLPENHKDQSRGRDNRKHQDEMRFKPVLALTFIEDYLQRAQAQRNQTEPDVIDASFAQLAALQVGRILNQPLRQQKGDDAHRNVDEENPAPAEV